MDVDIDEAIHNSAAELNSRFPETSEPDKEILVAHIKEMLQLGDEFIKSISAKGNTDLFECNVVCCLPGSLEEFVSKYQDYIGEQLKAARSRPLSGHKTLLHVK